MIALLCFVLATLAAPFKSKSRLEAENAALRHQMIVLQRKVHGRVRLTNIDRWFFIQLYRWFPSILKVLTIIRPETLVRWHRAGFRGYWRWKRTLIYAAPMSAFGVRAEIMQTCDHVAVSAGRARRAVRCSGANDRSIRRRARVHLWLSQE
jgi:hypothetical protein